MTDDRIKAAQSHIQQLLKAQPEYVIDTSEFQNVKTRLAMQENVHRLNKRDDRRPTLIRRESGKIDDNGSQQSDDSDDDRPTLKRSN